MFILFLLFLLNIFNLFYTENENKDSNSLLWIFDNKGFLRKDSLIGTFVQFNGPLKVNPSKEDNKFINLFVYEPYLIRKYFNISPSSLLRTGQSFKLILIKPLKEEYINVNYLNITIQAQLFYFNKENNNQGISSSSSQQKQLKVEEYELQIKLIDDENQINNNNNIKEELIIQNNNILIAKKDNLNCNIINLINSPENILKLKDYSKIKLFGSMANQFSIDNNNNNNLIIKYNNNNNKCLNLQLINKLQLFIENNEIPLIYKININDKEEENKINYYFTKKQFNIKINSSNLTIIPSTIILLSFIEPIIKNEVINNFIEFYLEEENNNNKSTKTILEINKNTGALFIKDFNYTISELKKKKGIAKFNVYLNISSKIYDKTLIILSLLLNNNNLKEEEEEENNNNNNYYYFEKSIYAFAVDPFNLNNLNNNKLLIGHLNILKNNNKLINEKEEKFPKFLISEGGEGYFNIENNNNNKVLLIYNGPIGQFTQNYTLKVILISGNLIDSSLVHVLIPGIGSSSPLFQKSFQRIIIHKNEENIISENNNNNNLFTLSAEDLDLDAHLIYKLINCECQTISGEEIKKEECLNYFSLSPNGTTGQWILSLIEKEEENNNNNVTLEDYLLNNNKQLGEALLNISVRDEEHPLEYNGFTLVLIKFYQQQNNKNNFEIINLIKKEEELFKQNNNNPILLKIKDSSPINSLIYSFGIFETLKKEKLIYSLYGNKNKFFFIDKELAILSVAFPLKNIGGSIFNLTIQINYLNNGTIYMKIPILITIIKTNNLNENKFKFSETFYKINNNNDEEEKENKIIIFNENLNNNTKLKLKYLNNEEEEIILNNNNNISFNYLKQIINNNNSYINPSSLFFIQAENKEKSTIVPIIYSENNLNNNLSILPIPSIPIINLTEDSPIGTFVLSIDFNLSPFKPFIRSLSNNYSSHLFRIERRTINSLVIKTNQTLKNKKEEKSLLNFEIISIIENKEILLYKFYIKIISNINCQPYFNENQQLYFNLNKQQLISSFNNNWISIGSLNANYNLKKECQPIIYFLEKNKEENNNELILIKINQQNGLILISLNNNNLTLLNNNKLIELIAWAQSGIFLSIKIKLIIQINNNLFKKLKSQPFNGISPLILQINENIPKGTILTKLNNNNNKLIIKKEENKQLIIEINENNEIKTNKEIDFEEFEELLPLNYLIYFENNNEEEEEKENYLKIKININNINDNNPIFEQNYYNFILEKNSNVGYIIGQINAFDYDNNDLIFYQLISCFYQFSQFSYQINPSNKIFSLDNNNGIISLNSPIEDLSSDGLFTLEFLAENLDGKKSNFNSFANIWIVESSDIISILINKSPVELDNLKIIEYLKYFYLNINLINLRLINKQIFPLNCLLKEIRYKPIILNNNNKEEDYEIPDRKLIILQTIFLNKTKILSFIEIEKIIKYLDINDLISFEQNLFYSSSSFSIQQKEKQLSSSPFTTQLFSFLIIFIFLLGMIISILFILICQRKRQQIIKKQILKLNNNNLKIKDLLFHQLPPLIPFPSFLQFNNNNNNNLLSPHPPLWLFYFN